MYVYIYMHYAYIKLNINPLCICKCVVYVRIYKYSIMCAHYCMQSIYNIENAHIHVNTYTNMCIYIYIHHTYNIHIYIYICWDTTCWASGFRETPRDVSKRIRVQLRFKPRVAAWLLVLEKENVSHIQPRISTNDQDSKKCLKKLWNRSRILGGPKPCLFETFS